MKTEPVIVAQGLTRRFGELVAVDGLDLQVNPGEVFGFLGHNGAGKTTTIRLLNGILRSSDGSARVLGLNPARDGASLRRRTGVLTETPSLDGRLTARETLRTHAEVYGVPRPEINSRVDSILEDFELGDRADQKTASYSSGMKQRLALARALFHQPEVLFLDEPTAGLDPIAARRVHDLIGKLADVEKRTAIICTHNLVEAQRLCNRVAVLEKGRLLAIGTPAELARGLGGSLSLEIEVAPQYTAQALALLGASSGIVDSPTPQNGMITLAITSRDVIPGLIAVLVEGGVPVYRITPQDPSLEDIYFALHGKKGDGA